mgnify:CR=1 FL=1
MDIKDFVKEAIGAIAEATVELQAQYDDTGTVINPPVSVKERDLYREGEIEGTYRRVQLVDFDIAVTASGETGSGGKAGLKILSIEAGMDGTQSRRNEQASRVKFSIPLSLAPSHAEAANKKATEESSSKTLGISAGR